jgi:hypothetical protein
MKLSAKNECRALIIFGAIFFAAGCLAGRPAWRSYQFRNSVPVPAQILALGIKKGRKATSTVAQYTYTYSGIKYSSTSVSPVADHGRIYQQLTETHEPLAYIDPSNPSRSYLDPTLTPFERYTSTVMGILLPFVGSLIAIFGIKRLKNFSSSARNRTEPTGSGR